MMMATTDDLGDRVRRAVGSRYLVEQQIGAGGSSIVFAARARDSGRQVALKVLRPEFAASTFATRFEREIQVMRALVHPHIVPILDAGVADDLVYLVMPLLEQASLRDRLRASGPLPVDEALRIAREVASALAHSHAAGIVHRDVKPANVMLVGDTTAMVTDFGVAHLAVAEDGESLTASGVSIGTPEYMSPEQASGSRHVDARADVYALGCMLYEMLAGEPPFSGRSAQTVITRQLHDAPTPPSRLRRAIPPNVEAAILKALAKTPVDRHPSVEAFVAALDAPLPRPKPTARRRGILLVASLGIAATALVVVLLPARPVLDPSRVVIFPLREVGLPTTDGTGEAVSTFVGYALESVEPLKWLNGADLLGDTERRPGAVLSTPRLRELARRSRAAFFIEGTLSRDGDSTSALLTLHTVDGDSVLRRGRAASPTVGASLPKVGLRAVSQILPALLAPGRRIDLSVLRDRDAVAIGHFLAGERAYRAMRFREASQHFGAAVAGDSVFAIAALRGALSASWAEHMDTARAFAQAASRGESALPAKYAWVARGVAHYIAGRAAAAAAAFDSAITRDSAMADAWMGLAESYYHFAPSLPAVDSLAERAYRQVIARDSTFSPAHFHLAQIELRRRQTTSADRYLGRTLEVDTVFRRQIALMRDCVTGSARVAWQDVAAAQVQVALNVAKTLSSPTTHIACADSAFLAVLRLPTATGAQRWGALVGATSSLIGSNRTEDAIQLLASSDASGLPGWSLVLLASAIEGKALGSADSVVTALGTGYAAMSSNWLWLLMNWHSMRGASTELKAIHQVLQSRTDTTHRRVDSLFTRNAMARLSLAQHDTAAAIQALQSLEPNGTRAELTWQPWEALAGERLLLAQLLLARGRPAEAAKVAAYLDAPEPIVHVMYRRQAIELRIRSATALGNRREVARLQSLVRALTTRDRAS